MKLMEYGPQWTVPRIGYENKDRNSGRVLRKDMKLMEYGPRWTVPLIGYENKDRNSGRVLCKDMKLMDKDHNGRCLV
jgi:hypothetical protein